ncbi:Hypothetical protein D9617_55g071600 [Elsinoe fawcettii]|nr:Hypothetical protein D9617_55g071600 [Elsinoe fawcettii]
MADSHVELQELYCNIVLPPDIPTPEYHDLRAIASALVARLIKVTDNMMKESSPGFRVEPTIHFEVFEMSAPSAAALQATDAIQWDFPGRAVQVPQSLFQATIQKAGVQLTEVRDTPSPALISQVSLSLLEAIECATEVPLLRKRVRDDINFRIAKMPWRRLSYWLILRVGRQRQLCLTLGPNLAGPLNLHSSKLGRRMAKLTSEKTELDSNDATTFDDTFDNTAAKIEAATLPASDSINKAWSSFKHKNERPVHILPKWATIEDTHLALRNSGRYLDHILALQSTTVMPPSSLELATDELSKTTESQQLALKHINLASADRGLRAELVGNKDNSRLEEQVQTLADGMLQFLATVGETYRVTPSLFRDISFHFDIGGLDAMIAVAASDRLAAHVRTITLRQDHSAARFDDMRDWCDATVYDYEPALPIEEEEEEEELEILPDTMSKSVWKALGEEGRAQLYREYEKERQDRTRRAGFLAAAIAERFFTEDNHDDSHLSDDGESDGAFDDDGLDRVDHETVSWNGKDNSQHPAQESGDRGMNWAREQISCFSEAVAQLPQATHLLHCPISGREDELQLQWGKVQFHPWGLIRLSNGSDENEIEAISVLIAFNGVLLRSSTIHSFTMHVRDAAFWHSGHICRLLRDLKNGRRRGVLPSAWLRGIGYSDQRQTNEMTGRLSALQEVFGRVRSFDCLARSNDWEPSEQHAVATSLGAFLGKAHALEQLQLQLKSDEPFYKDRKFRSHDALKTWLADYGKASFGLFATAISTHSFRRIRNFSLSAVVSASDLIALFQRMDSLRSLSLANVALLPRSGRWETVLTHLALESRLESIDCLSLEDIVQYPRMLFQRSHPIWQEPSRDEITYEMYEKTIYSAILSGSSSLPPLDPTKDLTLRT